MPTVEIRLPYHQYAIHIGPGLIDRLGSMVRDQVPHHKAGVVIDSNVEKLYGRHVRQSLAESDYESQVAIMPAGEAYKTLETYRHLQDVMLNARLERKSPIIAVGGGVTGDTGGFVAATYLRGVPFVQCPTTLLAMVDASVGGKVGVDVPQGKNLVGAFYQPVLVVIDTDTLHTLPAREYRCGLAECVKHGMIRDASLFDWFGENAARILELDTETTVEMVERNVQIKAKVVMEDEKEAGVRAHLNFGHTFAHAIESTTGYQAYHHGEAVSLGMVAATSLACDLGRCDVAVLDRLVSVLESLGLPVSAGDLPQAEQLLAAMYTDKKVAGGRIRLVLPEDIGQVFIDADVPREAILEAWQTIRTSD